MQHLQDDLQEATDVDIMCFDLQARCESGVALTPHEVCPYCKLLRATERQRRADTFATAAFDVFGDSPRRSSLALSSHPRSWNLMTTYLVHTQVSLGSLFQDLLPCRPYSPLGSAMTRQRLTRTCLFVFATVPHVTLSGHASRSSRPTNQVPGTREAESCGLYICSHHQGGELYRAGLPFRPTSGAEPVICLWRPDKHARWTTADAALHHGPDDKSLNLSLVVFWK